MRSSWSNHSSLSSPTTHSHKINIAATARSLDVDNRISLRTYFRIADNILKQADIFREEDNIIDLYVMLLRFSSLVTETIPCHRDYSASAKGKKVYLKQKLLNSLSELEELKPSVLQKLVELNGKHIDRASVSNYNHQNNTLEWPVVKRKSFASNEVVKPLRPPAKNLSHQVSGVQHFSYVRPMEDQFHRISLSYPRPKDETLARHSILGPNGLCAQWQPPRITDGVKYPSNIDLTPVEIPRLRQSAENVLPVKKDSGTSELGNLQQIIENANALNSDGLKSDSEGLSLESISSSESIPSGNDDNKTPPTQEEPPALISFEVTETPVQVDIIRQPSPPAILAEVQDLAPAVSPLVGVADHGVDFSSPETYVQSEAPLQLHISTTLMENFMKLAKSNTDRNLETCGVLAGSLKNRKFYVTALIIPKQESTSDSCQTTNEEEIFEVQDKRSLFPLGWIHTHPTQSCFMSSIDVHTHYSYQIMLPEAVAIVMAPRDTSRKHGIFRLTAPGGMSVIRQCQRRGFHPHDPPEDGGPIYKSCTDVYMNPKLEFDVIDLR